MAAPSEIVKRIRAQGANVIIDDGRLRLINRNRLTAEALAYIRQNAKAIAEFLDDEGEFEERAAIMEYDGGVPREWAEEFAGRLRQKRPDGVSDRQWEEFEVACAWMIDQLPAHREAA